MKRRGSTGWKVARGQQGLASIIIVITLAAILSLIALGSIRVANRNLNSSVSSQVGTNADYAVESGLNQVIKQIGGVPPAGSQATCAAGLTKYFTTPNQYLSTSQDTQITCALVDANPPTILEGNIGYGSDKLIKLQANNGASNYTPSSVLFSWRYTQNPSTPVSIRYAGAAPLKAAYTELKWNNLGATPQRPYPPLMQATFYPLTSSGVVLSTIVPKTVYFYPNDGTGLNITNNTYASLNSGQIVNANCKSVTLPSPPTFNYTDLGSYDCNAIVSALPNYLTNGSYMYMRVMPVYHNADVRVEADDLTGTPLNFSSSSQISVDVTAKAGFARKRLQARLGFSATGGNNFLAFTNPDYALRSAGTICKRYDVDGGGNITIPSGDINYCPGIAVNIGPPSLSFTANPTQVYSGQNTNLKWVVSGASSCTAGLGVPPGTNDWITNPSGTTKDPSTGTHTQSVGPLVGVGKIFRYTLYCTGPTGINTPTLTASVTVKPFPSVNLWETTTFSTNYSTDYYNKNSLSWNTTDASAFSSCSPGRSGAIPNSDGDWGTGTNPPVGAPPPTYGVASTKGAIPGITRERFYYITCQGIAPVPDTVSNTVDMTTNPPRFQIYPNYTSISSSGQPVTENWGGRCVNSPQVCGAMANVDKNVSGDTCISPPPNGITSPNDSPQGVHGKWLGTGGNPMPQWLNGPGSVTLTPSYPAGFNADNTSHYYLTCTNYGGHLGAAQSNQQSAEIDYQNSNPGPPPPPSQPPPPPPSGPPPIVIDGWNVGPLTYYKNLPFSNGQSHDCYYSTNHWASSVNYPYYSDSTGTHSWYVCSAAMQVHQYGYGVDPNLYCKLSVGGNNISGNGQGAPAFGPPDNAGWVQWYGNNGEPDQEPRWHTLGPNSNSNLDDSGWVLGWNDDPFNPGGSGYPAQIYATDSGGYPVYEFEWECYNSAEPATPHVFECIADWPVHYPSGSPDDSRPAQERIGGACPPPGNLP